MRQHENGGFESWLVSELLLVTLLGSATALFLTNSSLRNSYSVSEGRLVLDTTVVLVATIVAVLAGVRFSVDRRGLDLLLAAGFGAAAVGFNVLDRAGAGRRVTGRAGELGGDPGHALPRGMATLIALAAFVRQRRIDAGARALVIGGGLVLAALLAVWLLLRASAATSVAGYRGRRAGAGGDRRDVVPRALLALAAVVGFAIRYRERHGEDAGSWLALQGGPMTLFAGYYVLTPGLERDRLAGRLSAPPLVALLLVGVWRAVDPAELGRAVARNRLASLRRRSTTGSPSISSPFPRMRACSRPVAARGGAAQAAAAAAPRNRRRSSPCSRALVGGRHGPFDAALRRYVEVLTATARSRSTSRSTTAPSSRRTSRSRCSRSSGRGLRTCTSTRSRANGRTSGSASGSAVESWRSATTGWASTAQPDQGARD